MHSSCLEKLILNLIHVEKPRGRGEETDGEHRISERRP